MPNTRTHDGVDADASTRDRLLQAAVQAFREVGTSRTRVEDIASRAGVTTGALYKLFGSKADLLAEALGGKGESQLLDMKASIERQPGESFYERSCEALVYRFTHPGDPANDVMALGALTTAMHEADAAASVYPAAEQLRDDIADLLHAAADELSLPDDVSVDTTVDFISTVLLGTIVSRALDLHKPDVDEIRIVLQRILKPLLFART